MVPETLLPGAFHLATHDHAKIATSAPLGYMGQTGAVDYPFVPPSIRSIKRGHFWSIPLDDGRFACAIAVEERGRPDPLTGEPQPRMFMSALLDWVGTAPPTLDDVGTITAIVSHGYSASASIGASGGSICGWRNLDQVPIVLPETVTHRSPNAWVVRGSVRVRESTQAERDTMAGMGTYGATALQYEAKAIWSTTPKPASYARPVDRSEQASEPTALPALSSPGARPNPPTLGGEPDGLAVKILRRAFWSGGWKQSAVDPRDREYARAAGVMFEPVTLTHDQVVEWAIRARRAVSSQLVASAFVDSLASRRLDLRSALGSYAAFTHLEPHQQVGRWCDVCGHLDLDHEEDLDVLSFERFHFGGVRHRAPLYAAFDLDQLTRWRGETVPETMDVFNAVIDRWRALPPKARAGDAAKALMGLFPSNANERRTVVEIASLAGILTSDLDPPTKRLVAAGEQESAFDGRRTDWQYPTIGWRRSGGVDPAALVALLG